MRGVVLVRLSCRKLSRSSQELAPCVILRQPSSQRDSTPWWLLVRNGSSSRRFQGSGSGPLLASHQGRHIRRSMASLHSTVHISPSPSTASHHVRWPMVQQLAAGGRCDPLAGRAGQRVRPSLAPGSVLPTHVEHRQHLLGRSICGASRACPGAPPGPLQCLSLFCASCPRLGAHGEGRSLGDGAVTGARTLA